MGLILEGPDASGKSTLARLISQESGMPLFLAGGKPKDDQQMWIMIADQRHAADCNSIVDRVSSISQQVYREGLYMRDDLMEEALYLCRSSIMVYCRPPMNVLMDPHKHEWKEYDTEEWKQQILANQEVYVSRYDHLMTKIPCIIYDWTAENSDHLRNLLCEFHQPVIRERLREMIKFNQTSK
jgi:adenylate kinase family enzyme